MPVRRYVSRVALLAVLAERRRVEPHPAHPRAGGALLRQRRRLEPHAGHAGHGRRSRVVARRDPDRAGRQDGTSDVYLMNADGSNRVQLTRGSTGNLLPAWPSDGARIAFQTNRDGDWEVYVMNADGTGLVNLSVSRGPDVEPDWRPKK
jgi:hypothetical protein